MKYSVAAFILVLTGCTTTTYPYRTVQYCGVEYSDGYDLAKGVLPHPPEPAPRVVIHYTYEDIKSNPFYYPVNTF